MDRSKEKCKRSNRNSRRRKRQTSAAARAPTEDDGIEKQLRRQRLKRQQQQGVADEEQQETKKPADRLGEYVYDPERDAYFQEKDLKEQRKQEARDEEVDPEDACEECAPAFHNSREVRSSVSMSYLWNICGTKARRRDLTIEWRGRLLLEQMHSQSIGDSQGHCRPMHSSGNALPLWSRTFGIVSPSSSSPPKLLRIEKDLLMEYCCNDEGALVFIGSNTTHIKTFKDSRYVLMQQTECVCKVSAYLSNGLCQYQTDLPPGINDCAPCRDTVLYAGRSSKLFWIDEVLARSGSFGEISLRSSNNSLISEVLVIESIPRTTDSFVMGHRNGQISVLDIRAGDYSCSSIPHTSAAKGDFGSVVSLNPLFEQRPHELLVRGGLEGTCRLYDVRMFGTSSTAKDSSPEKDPSVVHEFQMPRQRRHHISKGVATDPSQTVALVPFVKNDDSACLGVWSLDSGSFVGSKTVAAIAKDCLETYAGLDCLEICPTMTPAWKLGEGSAASVPGAFGLWLNGGTSGLHHIICDGRWDC